MSPWEAPSPSRCATRYEEQRRRRRPCWPFRPWRRGSPDSAPLELTVHVWAVPRRGTPTYRSSAPGVPRTQGRLASVSDSPSPGSPFDDPRRVTFPFELLHLVTEYGRIAPIAPAETRCGRVTFLDTGARSDVDAGTSMRLQAAVRQRPAQHQHRSEDRGRDPKTTQKRVVFTATTKRRRNIVGDWKREAGRSRIDRCGGRRSRGRGERGEGLASLPLGSELWAVRALRWPRPRALPAVVRALQQRRVYAGRQGLSQDVKPPGDRGHARRLADHPWRGRPERHHPGLQIVVRGRTDPLPDVRRGPALAPGELPSTRHEIRKPGPRPRGADGVRRRPSCAKALQLEPCVSRRARELAKLSVRQLVCPS